MAEECKISVIMPVYKVEQYVGRAIESILNQTLSEFEFLIVDDGTPDRSGEICDEYAGRDSRIRVFHKENGGAPSARNLAMEHAQGKYFYFMDSDDWAEPNMLAEMYALAEKTQAQLVVAGFYIETYYSETEFVTTELACPDRVFATQQEFRENAYQLFDKNLLYTPWNKLFRADYLMERGLRFPQTWMDDFPFNLMVIRDIERVAVTGKKYYHFMRARAESETARYRDDLYPKREEEHGWMLELYQHWQVDNQPSREFVARRYVERALGCVENVTNPSCTLDRGGQRAAIREIVQNPRLAEAFRDAKPHSLYMKLALLPLRWKNVTLCRWEGKVISRVKTGNVKTFTKLKAGR